MKNSKGQSLVLFLIIIPVLITFICSIVDFSYVLEEKNKLNNINKYVVGVAKNNVNELEQLIYLNDKDIVIKKIDINNNNITISLEKNVKSLFGNIIGIKSYNIKSLYEMNKKTGNIKNKL